MFDSSLEAYVGPNRIQVLYTRCATHRTTDEHAKNVCILMCAASLFGSRGNVLQLPEAISGRRMKQPQWRPHRQYSHRFMVLPLLLPMQDQDPPRDNCSCCLVLCCSCLRSPPVSSQALMPPVSVS